MIPRLVWRSLARRPGRSALLLVGYALGVAVTLVLLSIGRALVEQARDRELVGGGDLTVIPEGLDLETLKTGGVSSLYFSIRQAPFLYRQVLAGPRFGDEVAAAAPWMDDELVYLEVGGEVHPVDAQGRIPSLSRSLGVRTRVEEGRWEDGAADRRWRAPGDSALYAELDAFHLPGGEAAGDTAWAEWHYFNVLLPGGRGWLYLTYMVAGAVPEGRWGGRVLATLVTPATGRPGGRGGSGGGPGTTVRQFEARVPAERVRFSLSRPDLRVGGSTVALDGAGRYRIRARVPAAEGGPAGSAAPGASPEARIHAEGGGADAEAPSGGRARLRVELTVRAASRRYLPPVELSAGGRASGYVVPVLDGRAVGRVCVEHRCVRVEEARAYHDHNWGVWRGVTWDWGQAHAGPYSVLYGGVRGSAPGGDDGEAGGTDAAAGPGDGADPSRLAGSPAGARQGAFLLLADSLGFLGLHPLREVSHRWEGRTPAGITVRAGRGGDSAWLEVRVEHARSTPAGLAAGAAGRALRFHQMQGRAHLRAWLNGVRRQGSGPGFFETWTAEVAGGGAGTHLEREPTAGAPEPWGAPAGAPRCMGLPRIDRKTTDPG